MKFSLDSKFESSTVKTVLTVLCIGIALYYLYTGFLGMHTPKQQMVPIVMIGLIVVFLTHPLKGQARFLDYILVGWCFYIGYYLIAKEMVMAWYIAPAGGWDIVVAGSLFVFIFEATRRCLGWALTGILIGFLLYALFGNYIPGPFHHSGFSLRKVVDRMALTDQGVFAVPIQIVSTLIVYYMIFASFLRLSGGGASITALARSLFGKYRGGPAKIAVVASTLFGMISGSAMANVAVDGYITIPLMKNTGYEPKKAAAIEAVASTGGQFMPPIMGAAAFLIAESIGVSYWSVVKAAFLPALLYYIALFFLVDFEAGKAHLKGLPASELPRFKEVIRLGWVFAVPVVILLVLLGALKMSATWSVLWSLISLWVVTSMFKGTRMNPATFRDSLVDGIKSMSEVIIACAAAGIVMGIVYLTNFGFVLSSILIEVSHGNVLVLLILAAFTCLILGMGMTTTAIYLFLAMLVAPTLVKMGIPVMQAHLFIFYYGCLFAITPPVCTASYVAAGIANSPPMATAWTASAWASIAYILPFFWIYRPALILQGSIGDISIAVVISVIGAISLAAGIAGYFSTRLNVAQRIMFGAGGITLMAPGWQTDVIGIALIVLAFLWQRKTRKSTTNT